MDILEYYRPTSVVDQLRWALKRKLKEGIDPFPGIEGRKETKKEVDARILSGSHIYLVSQEGTGKTKL